ncbi:MAG: hypothetical protein WC518_03315 [Patescibacteria group bacterium]
MTIKYSQLKNIPRRARLAVGLAAGIVFFILLICSFWNQCFADTLINYASGDSVFYAHFSLPKLNDSQQFRAVLSRVLADNNLSAVELRYLKRELAVIGRPAGDRLSFSVLLRTDRPRQLEKILTAKQIPHRFLDRSRVVIAAPSELNAFVSNRKNPAKQAVAGKFSLFDSLSVYLKPEFFDHFPQDIFLNLVKTALSDDKGRVFLNVRVGRGAVVVSGASSKAAKKIKSESTNLDPNFDLALCLSGADAWLADRVRAPANSGSGYWQNYWNLLAVNSLLDKEFLGRMFGQNLFLAFSLNQRQYQSGWFFKDYDFYLNSLVAGDGLSPADLQNWEKILQLALAVRFPKERPTLLRDGTQLIEFKAETDDFRFESLGEARLLSAPDKSATIFYRLKNGSLSATNKKSWLSLQSADSCRKYLKVKTKLLPDVGFFSYLKYFDVLEIKDGLLLMR